MIPTFVLHFLHHSLYSLTPFMMKEKLCFTPDWPAPRNIHAYTTTRHGGVSQAPFNTMNLGLNTEDSNENIEQNRKQLIQQFNLPSEPFWLHQVHGTRSVDIGTCPSATADAAYTCKKHTVCAILTADCLPILVCNTQGTHVAAIHGGWRGLADGIVEKTLKQLNLPPEETLVWLGPGISKKYYIVGDDVKKIFENFDDQAKAAFSFHSPAKWFCDLFLIARQRLHNCHVNQVVGGDICTYQDTNNLFSYRRETPTGRMVSLIWIE